MFRRSSITVVLLCCMAFAQDERDLVVIDAGGLAFVGSISANYQRSLSNRHCTGIAVRINTSYFRGPSSYSAFVGYDFYSKEAFKGLWVRVYTGIEKWPGQDAAVPLVAGLGYRWKIRNRFTFGLNCAVGPNFGLNQSAGNIAFSYLFPVDIGIAF